jgi:hypothetical protein
MPRLPLVRTREGATRNGHVRLGLWVSERAKAWLIRRALDTNRSVSAVVEELIGQAMAEDKEDA